MYVDTPRLRVRLLGGLWAAGVATIPAWLAAGPGEENLRSLISSAPSPGRFGLTALAVGAAAIAGFVFGYRIIDPRTYHTVTGALLLSALTWLLSYYLMTVGYGLYLTVYTVQGQSWQEWLALPFSLLVFLPGFLLYFGIILTGWYTLPVALAAGLVLSMIYRE